MPILNNIHADFDTKRPCWTRLWCVETSCQFFQLQQLWSDKLGLIIMNILISTLPKAKPTPPQYLGNETKYYVPLHVYSLKSRMTF
jgi:hypothetical protein